MKQLPDDYGQAHVKGSAFYPASVYNGWLRQKQNRQPPPDHDLSPIEFRRFVNIGQADVQLSNALPRRIARGLRGPLDFVDYLHTAVPIIPGQMRDNYGGFIKHGIDPLTYRQLWEEGPGSQPAAPPGPGKIAAEYFYNPGTS